MDLDKTLDIYNFILNEYAILSDDGILAINYTGYSQNNRLYHLLDWYISYGNGQSNIKFDNRYFDYYILMKMLKSKGD